MDTTQKIAISKLADILTDSNLLIVNKDMWKRIFNNAGQSNMYEDFSNRLVETSTEINWKIFYNHNDRSYSALNEIFSNLQESPEEFIILLNSIIDKFNVDNIFVDDIKKRLGIKARNHEIFDIKIYLKNKDIEEKNSLLYQYSSDSFKLFKSNLNMLNLDVIYLEDNLKVIPFTNRNTESNFSINILEEWLGRYFPNIQRNYGDAIKAYSNGDAIGCITHCRVTITGIFSHFKDGQRKWKNGLLKACIKDKNISNINRIDDIPTLKYNENSDVINERYQYPRYNLIYRLYTFTCALGAHASEGNITDRGIDNEETSLEDAFMAIRMTEDILIWLYQTKVIDYPQEDN